MIFEGFGLKASAFGIFGNCGAAADSGYKVDACHF